MKICINHKHVVKCLEPTKTISCYAFKININKYIYIYICMFLPVLKSILSWFPAPCLNFEEKWRDTCVILKLQGQPKKKQKNKLPVKTGLCHVLSWLFRFVISDICLAQKIFRSGHFSAYTRQIVKICINQKNLLRNTVNMLRFQNDILSFGPAL